MLSDFIDNTIPQSREPVRDEAGAYWRYSSMKLEVGTRVQVCRLCRFMCTAIVAIGAILATGSGCCGWFGLPRPDSITEVSYGFGDASVAPEYHRSYTISVTSDHACVAIFAYGEIHLEQEFAVTGAEFEALKNSLHTYCIRSCVLVARPGCAGGTSESITLLGGSSELFAASVYHCAGQDSGNLCGDLRGFAEAIENLIPNLDELIESTRDL